MDVTNRRERAYRGRRKRPPLLVVTPIDIGGSMSMTRGFLIGLTAFALGCGSSGQGGTAGSSGGGTSGGTAGATGSGGSDQGAGGTNTGGSSGPGNGGTTSGGGG